MYGGALAFSELPFASTSLPKKSAQRVETWLPDFEHRAPQYTYSEDRPIFAQLKRVTGRVREELSPATSVDLALPGIQEVSLADTTANSRSLLLAVKYGEGLKTREQAVRLEILTTRLRRLAPKVTEAHWSAIEDGAAHIEQVDSRLLAIKARIAKL